MVVSCRSARMLSMRIQTSAAGKVLFSMLATFIMLTSGGHNAPVLAKFWGFTNDSSMIFTPGFDRVIRPGGSFEVVPRLSIDRLIENASVFDADFPGAATPPHAGTTADSSFVKVGTNACYGGFEFKSMELVTVPGIRTVPVKRQPVQFGPKMGPAMCRSVASSVPPLASQKGAGWGWARFWNYNWVLFLICACTLVPEVREVCAGFGSRALRRFLSSAAMQELFSMVLLAQITQAKFSSQESSVRERPDPTDVPPQCGCFGGGFMCYNPCAESDNGYGWLDFCKSCLGTCICNCSGCLEDGYTSSLPGWGWQSPAPHSAQCFSCDESVSGETKTPAAPVSTRPSRRGSSMAFAKAPQFYRLVRIVVIFLMLPLVAATCTICGGFFSGCTGGSDGSTCTYTAAVGANTKALAATSAAALSLVGMFRPSVTRVFNTTVLSLLKTYATLPVAGTPFSYTKADGTPKKGSDIVEAVLAGKVSKAEVQVHFTRLIEALDDASVTPEERAAKLPIIEAQVNLLRGVDDKPLLSFGAYVPPHPCPRLVE